jgi:hypothetical protein
MRISEYKSIYDQGGEVMHYATGVLGRDVKDLSVFST